MFYECWRCSVSSRAVMHSFNCVRGSCRLSWRIDVELDNRLVDVVSVDIHTLSLLWKAMIPLQKELRDLHPNRFLVVISVSFKLVHVTSRCVKAGYRVF